MCIRDRINASFHINLIKNIPVAAGMAGGSTDAAACFTALNDMFNLDIAKEELMKLSVKLGADIPYCICLLYTSCAAPSFLLQKSESVQK